MLIALLFGEWAALVDSAIGLGAALTLGFGLSFIGVTKASPAWFHRIRAAPLLVAGRIPLVAHKGWGENTPGLTVPPKT